MATSHQQSAFRKYVPGWVLPTLLVFSVGTVALRLKIVDLNLDIHQIDKSIDNGKKERERLNWRVMRLKSPEHLERLSKQKFKLGPPAPEQIIHMGHTPAADTKPAPKPGARR